MTEDRGRLLFSPRELRVAARNRARCHAALAIAAALAWCAFAFWLGWIGWPA